MANQSTTSTSNVIPTPEHQVRFSTTSLPKLSDEASWIPWKKALSLWLTSNDLLDIVTNPPSDYTRADLKKSSDALLAIFSTVEKYHIASMHSFSYASEAWKYLHELFDVKDSMQISELKASLASITINPNEQVIEYYSRLMALRNDLKSYGDVSVTDVDVITYFLLGLRDRQEFTIVRKQLKFAGNLTLPRVLKHITEAEAEHKAMVEKEGMSTALKAVSLSDGQKKGLLFCTYCKARDHEKPNCAKLAAKLKRDGKKSKEKEEPAALLGEASTSGVSGLVVERSFRAGATWEEAGL
jgi:hypothetical protein